MSIDSTPTRSRSCCRISCTRGESSGWPTTAGVRRGAAASRRPSPSCRRGRSRGGTRGRRAARTRARARPRRRSRSAGRTPRRAAARCRSCAARTRRRRAARGTAASSSETPSALPEVVAHARLRPREERDGERVADEVDAVQDRHRKPAAAVVEAAVDDAVREPVAHPFRPRPQRLLFRTLPAGLYNSGWNERSPRPARPGQRALRPRAVLPGRAARPRIRRRGAAASAGHAPAIVDLRFGRRLAGWIRRDAAARRGDLGDARARVRPAPRDGARDPPALARRVHPRRRPRGGGLLRSRSSATRWTRSAWTTARRSSPRSSRRARGGRPLAQRPGPAAADAGRLDLDAAALRAHGPRPRSASRARPRRALPQPLPLPALQARLADRDGARLPLPLQLLLGLAALRPLVPRAVDRRGRGRLRVRRRQRLRRRRPLLEPPRRGASSSRGR